VEKEFKFSQKGDIEKFFTEILSYKVVLREERRERLFGLR
jgi:hypothetical protein